MYKAGKYGIRIENELLTVRTNHTGDGIFNSFKNITFCPMQLEMVDTTLLSQFEIERINEYQDLCRDQLMPLCEDKPELKAFLIEKTGHLTK